MDKISVFIAAAALTVGLQTAVAADIVGVVTLKGTPPPEKEITPLKDDPTCGKFYTSMPTTHFYMVGPKGELADVVVALTGITGKSTGATAPAAELDQSKCLYTPYVMAIQTGQKLIVRNSDPVLHNVHDTPLVPGNKEYNVAQVPGGPPLTFSFDKPENFLRFKCDVHPWMFAYVSIFDHPYFSVTGGDGRFVIKNVPPGKYTIEARHRKAGVVTKDVEVKDSDVTMDFTLEVK